MCSIWTKLDSTASWLLHHIYVWHEVHAPARYSVLSVINVKAVTSLRVWEIAENRAIVQSESETKVRLGEKGEKSLKWTDLRGEYSSSLNSGWILKDAIQSLFIRCHYLLLWHYFTTAGEKEIHFSYLFIQTGLSSHFCCSEKRTIWGFEIQKQIVCTLFSKNKNKKIK